MSPCMNPTGMLTAIPSSPQPPCWRLQGLLPITGWAPPTLMSAVAAGLGGWVALGPVRPPGQWLMSHDLGRLILTEANLALRPVILSREAEAEVSSVWKSTKEVRTKCHIVLCRMEDNKFNSIQFFVSIHTEQYNFILIIKLSTAWVNCTKCHVVLNYSWYRFR